MLGFLAIALAWASIGWVAEAADADVARLRGAPTHTASGKHGAVATVQPVATEAALEVLRSGGNAVDAMVTAALVLGVVDGENSGIGGGCFVLLRRANGEIVALDGREMAPAKATRDMFLRDGKAVSELSVTGPLAAGVPGSLAVYEQLSREYGRQPMALHLERAAEIAERGFVVTKGYAHRLTEATNELARFPASKAVFLHADGTPYQAGERLIQTDLAATYRAMAKEGVGWFYSGEFARRTEAWMRENGGLLTAEDFRAYEVRRREPIRTRYRGYEIVGFPPPSSGGVHIAQILNMLEPKPLSGMKDGSSEFIHRVGECMKVAFADRAFWLGDSDFARVPRGLTDKSYARRLARGISPNASTPVPGHGLPPRAAEDLFGRHTTHFVAVDAEGNWACCTATVNTTFGSKVVIPGTGVVLNNQMDDFVSEPGVPNFFGLMGAEANAVEARKRPLSSMSPTIVLKKGVPVLAAGAAGGPTIITQTLLTIIRVLDYGEPLDQALAQPRFHHQWRPDELVVEASVPESVRKSLEQKGHRVKATRVLGATQAVTRSPDGEFTAAADPRSGGSAGAW